MRREILLLDVTAMERGHVCVAGWDLRANTNVRLHQPATPRWLVKQLGNLGPGDVIQAEWRPVRKVQAPHTEDGIWDPDSVRLSHRLDADEVAGIIAPSAFGSVVDAFGEPWQEGRRGNHAWRPGAGARSLATLRVRSARVYGAAQDPRVALIDESGREWPSVPMQDLRVHLHREACASCSRTLLKALQDEFSASEVLVRVGLTRPYTPDDRPPGCWLQVTNILARPRAHFL